MKGISFCGCLSTSVSFTYSLRDLLFQRASKLSTVHIAILRNDSQASMAVHSISKDVHGGTLQLLFDGAPSRINCLHLALDLDLSTEKCENKKTAEEEIQFLGFDVGLSEKTDVACKSAQDVTDKEIQRRLKIGAANRGRTPWNKGRKHTEETRERIKKRTIEALSDPKVRKKMSECPHFHSDQSKSRISSSLTKIWQERLKLKRLQEKCYMLWARTIAEAAKIGSLDQEELEWDSYEKMKGDMISQQIKLKAEKTRAKEIARLRAERVAKNKAEQVAKLAEQRKLQKGKAKATKLEVLSQKKSDKERKKIELYKGLKLKARLTKFHHRMRQLKSSPNFQTEIISEPGPDLKRWDMELIKNERMQRRVSLADQIKAVRNRKAEFAGQRVQENAFLDSSYEQRPGDQ